MTVPPPDRATSTRTRVDLPARRLRALLESASLTALVFPAAIEKLRLASRTGLLARVRRRTVPLHAVVPLQETETPTVLPSSVSRLAPTAAVGGGGVG